MIKSSKEQLKYFSQRLGKKLAELKLTRPVKLVEVCGTHTHSSFASGIRDLLPPGLKLLSGPGCPVCVTPPGYIDLALDLAEMPDVITATFGDMIRVPGTRGTLQQVKGSLKNVRVVYSSLDALELALQNPSKKVVFLAVGFETTAPTIAATILRANHRGVKNLSFLTSLKLMPNAIRELLNDREVSIDGILLPGHVCAVTGSRAFSFISREYKLPSAAAGFQPLEMLAAVINLAAWAAERRAVSANFYSSVVSEHGNLQAKKIINQVFTKTNAVWRGLGEIPGSGLIIKPELSHFDARQVYGLKEKTSTCPPGCRCGEVIKGKIIPPQCPLFNKSCRPENPMGPCMVSSEGACSAYYKYSLQLGGV